MSKTEEKSVKNSNVKAQSKLGQVVDNQNQSDQNAEMVSENERLKSESLESLNEMERLMDDEEGPQKLSRSVNPYLGGEKCLLCRRERPDAPKIQAIEESADNASSQLAQLPLWVCPCCRENLEQEEKALTESTLFTQDLVYQPGDLFEMAISKSIESSNPEAEPCTCEPCKERRDIETQQAIEWKELQSFWADVRQAVRCMYREATIEKTLNTKHDLQSLSNMVSRLTSRDPHQLFQRLESQAREFVIEMKVRLLKKLTAGLKTPQQATQFIAIMLEEYDSLCNASRKVTTILSELEKTHMQSFKLTWDMLNRHLFQSIIYSDPLLQNSLPMIITQMSRYAGSGETHTVENLAFYPSLLNRYLKLDDEMTVISVVWRDSQKLIDEFVQEETAMKMKQKMLKEDWEFFKTQQKLLKKLVKTSDTASQKQLEDTFKEAMQELLSGAHPGCPPEGECDCPKCHNNRCPCEECTLSQVLASKIISSDVSDEFVQAASRLIIDVTPPSFSSSSGNSSRSSSPDPHSGNSLRQQGWHKAIEDSDKQKEINQKCSCLHCTKPCTTTAKHKDCDCHSCTKQQPKSNLSLPPLYQRAGQCNQHGGYPQPTYNLHMSGTAQTQKPHTYALDLDSSDSLHENIYHAYGDWENGYDSGKWLLNSCKFNLLKNDMMKAGFLHSDGSGDHNNVETLAPTSQETQQLAIDCSKLKLGQETSSADVAESYCKQLERLQKLQQETKSSTVSNHGEASPAGGKLSCEQQQQKAAAMHNQLKALQAKLTPEMIQSAALNMAKDEAIRALQQRGQAAAVAAQQSCERKNCPPPKPAEPLPVAPPVNGCCKTGDCHCDDDVDDSCSERSTSTTSSTQKESKQCDCYYCEFFGHGVGAVTPVSRNYPEMRERLRLRLTRKKSECRNAMRASSLDHSESNERNEHENPGTQSIDDILQFINGQTTNQAKSSDRVSKKAAKRLRQKQKKIQQKNDASEAATEETQQTEKPKEPVKEPAKEPVQDPVKDPVKDSKPKIVVTTKPNTTTETANNKATLINSQPKIQTLTNDTRQINGKPIVLPPRRIGPIITASKSQQTTGEYVVPTKPANVQSAMKEKPMVNGSTVQPSRSEPKLDGRKALAEIDNATERANKKQRTNGRPGVQLSAGQVNGHAKAGRSQNHEDTSKPEEESQPQRVAQNNAGIGAMQNNVNNNTPQTRKKERRKKGNTNKVVEPEWQPEPPPPEPLVKLPQDTKQKTGKTVKEMPITPAPENNIKKKKGKSGTGATVDDVFKPKADAEVSELDDIEREVEAFKRFCYDSTPAEKREKVKVKIDCNSLFKKKHPVSCSN